jgi:hypothetical protein
MSIFETVSGLLRRTSAPATTIDETLELQADAQAGISRLNRKFGAVDERREAITECRRMYREDPRAKGIVSTLARDITQAGFVVETGDPRATEIAQDLVKRLKLQSRLDDWSRLAFRDGDCFLELGVSEQQRIDVVSRKPTLRIHRNSDDRDQFADPTRAYWMPRRPFGAALGREPQDAIWFADWQIVHARWDHDEGERYGNPLLAAARKAWKRVREGEFDVAVRRKTRAGLRFVHRLRGSSAGDLEEYKAVNRAALDDKFAALTDFFMSDGDGVDVIQGDANLGDIDDVLHHVHTFFLASPVPMAVLGYGQDINYSVVAEQKKQYGETLPAVQRWLASAFILPILEVEWLLHGFLPESLDAHVTFGTKKQIDADQVQKIASALSTLRLLGVGEQAIRAILSHFLPGIEVEELPTDVAGENAAELAQIVQQLGAQLGQAERANGANQ